MLHQISKISGVIFLILVSFGLYAQTGKLTGVVKDPEGQPLAGAVLYYEETNVSSVTDAQGRYSISSMPGKTLVISIMGMKTQKVAIAKQTRLDILMEIDDMVLDDVVVIGYGTQNREDLTGSIASVKADEIKKSGENTLVGSLQGKVAGLSINAQSGEPGSGYQIRIRGANSINASSEPLYIIDGVQMDLSSTNGTESDYNSTGSDPLAFLNPSDIQSVEVLKDASATAIYGSRGANGVIIIATKNGVDNAGKTAVTIDASVGLSQVSRRIDMLDGQEWVNYRWERSDYGGRSSFDDGTGKPIDVSNQPWYNWQDIMFRNAITTNFGATVRTQISNKTQILLSASYMNQDGVVIGNNLKRYTARVKVDHNISKNLKIGANVSYSMNVGDGAMTSITGGQTNGLIQLIYRERPINAVTSQDDEFMSTIGFTSLLDFVNGKTESKKHIQRVLGTFYLDWKIIDGLSLNLQASGNTSNSNIKEFFSKESRWGRQPGGKVTHKTVEQMGYNASARLTYKKTWNKAHNFEAMLGGEISESSYDRMKLAAENFIDESSTLYDISKGTVQKAPDQYYYTVGRLSAFGRINYNFKSRYYATFTMRADGSSRFAEGHRVGYFPSGSLGWRASKEDFLKPQKWLSNLMLRASAGASGNDRIPMYSNLALMGVNYTSVSGTEKMGISAISIDSPDLKWETTYQYNVGLDFSVLKNRISLTADVFYKDTRDMLYLATLSSQAGMPTGYQNLGRVDNRGIELSLNTKNIDRNGFLWTTNITFDMNRNRVCDIGEGLKYTAVSDKGNFATEYTRIVVGEPIGVAYGYVADGNYQFSDFVITKNGVEVTDYSEITSRNFNDYTYTLKEDVVKISGKTSIKPGDRKYKDIYGDDGIVNDNDRTVISRPYPIFSAGLGNTLSWKGFDFYFFFDGSYGREMLNEFKMRIESGETGGTHQYNITNESYYGAWRPENQSNTYSRLLNNTNTWCSSYYVEDASYIRLKTLSLSYNLPAKACRAIHFKGLMFSFTVDNVVTFTKYSGSDPTISSSKSLFPAYDTMQYPIARSYKFGITANF